MIFATLNLERQHQTVGKRAKEKNTQLVSLEKCNNKPSMVVTIQTQRYVYKMKLNKIEARMNSRHMKLVLYKTLRYLFRV